MLVDFNFGEYFYIWKVSGREETLNACKNYKREMDPRIIHEHHSTLQSEQMAREVKC